MSGKLLTIAVPTFNRAKTLNLLLHTLLIELSGLEEHVDVIVGDNASTDSTPKVTAAFKAALPAAILLRHTYNLGADENFCRCIERVNTKYFWIIGDDDIPKLGVIKKIINILESETPDLVYLHSEWSRQITSASQGIPVERLHYKILNQLNFARRVNVWATFISGMIVNRETFMQTHSEALTRRFAGTSLVQLGWVFENLKNGQKFIFVNDPCVLAKAENSGGYAVITVFSENFTRIVNNVFEENSTIANAFIFRNIVGYLPTLIWKARFKSIGDYHYDSLMINSITNIKKRIFYWILLKPIAVLPKYLSLVFVLFSLVFNRSVVFCDRLRIL